MIGRMLTILIANLVAMMPGKNHDWLQSFGIAGNEPSTIGDFLEPDFRGALESGRHFRFTTSFLRR
jgi:hypothetical protein